MWLHSIIPFSQIIVNVDVSVLHRLHDHIETQVKPSMKKFIGIYTTTRGADFLMYINILLENSINIYFFITFGRKPH